MTSLEVRGNGKGLGICPPGWDPAGWPNSSLRNESQSDFSSLCFNVSVPPPPGLRLKPRTHLPQAHLWSLLREVLLLCRLNWDGCMDNVHPAQSRTPLLDTVRISKPAAEHRRCPTRQSGTRGLGTPGSWVSPVCSFPSAVLFKGSVNAKGYCSTSNTLGCSSHNGEPSVHKPGRVPHHPDKQEMMEI